MLVPALLEQSFSRRVWMGQKVPPQSIREGFRVGLDRRYSVITLLLGIFFLNVPTTYAQQPELGECIERPTVITEEFYVDNFRWCVEGIVDASDIEPMAFTAMEVAPDGALYATRPLTGQVMVVRDTNDDFFPDTLEPFADGLTLPNGLAYHDEMLYVSGGSHIYRIDTDGTVETIVDDLPSGNGFWTGGIDIGEDDRLYVAIGAPCEACIFDDRERGSILSMELDGSNRQIVATGFRNPSDVEFYRGELWTLDTSPRGYDANTHDELNLVEDGGWYGFPYCIGVDIQIAESETLTCDDDILPVVQFGSSSSPRSLAAFPYDVLLGTEDTLIVVLSGEPSQVEFNGYKVVMISFDENNQPLGVTLLLPFRKDSGRQAYEPYTDAGYRARHILNLSEQGWGIYPQQPLAVAVSPKGWIYLSLTGAQIIALRPVHEIPSNYLYPTWTPMHPDYSPELRPPDDEAQAG